jgi:hypothetical protein
MVDLKIWCDFLIVVIRLMQIVAGLVGKILKLFKKLKLIRGQQKQKRSKTRVERPRSIAAHLRHGRRAGPHRTGDRGVPKATEKKTTILEMAVVQTRYRKRW